jgi:hypothetical protein
MYLRPPVRVALRRRVSTTSTTKTYTQISVSQPSSRQDDQRETTPSEQQTERATTKDSQRERQLKSSSYRHTGAVDESNTVPLQTPPPSSR